MARMQTIGQTALLFALNEKDAKDFLNSWEPGPDLMVYEGLTDNLPEVVASAVAKLHPKWHGYYQDALAVLFQGQGLFESGTESAVMAVQSYGIKNVARSKMAGEYREDWQKDLFPYLMIWNPLACTTVEPPPARSSRQ